MIMIMVIHKVIVSVIVMTVGVSVRDMYMVYTMVMIGFVLASVFV